MSSPAANSFFLLCATPAANSGNYDTKLKYYIDSYYPMDNIPLEIIYCIHKFCSLRTYNCMRICCKTLYNNIITLGIYSVRYYGAPVSNPIYDICLESGQTVFMTNGLHANNGIVKYMRYNCYYERLLTEVEFDLFTNRNYFKHERVNETCAFISIVRYHRLYIYKLVRDIRDIENYLDYINICDEWYTGPSGGFRILCEFFYENAIDIFNTMYRYDIHCSETPRIILIRGKNLLEF